MPARVRGYADDTTVPISRTIAEIQELVEKAGGKNFSLGHNGDAKPKRTWFRFQLKDYEYRFEVMQPPDPQKARAHWRKQLLLFKAQLVGVMDELKSPERIMLDNVVLQGDTTAGDVMVPRLRELQAAARTGVPLLGPAVRVIEG